MSDQPALGPDDSDDEPTAGPANDGADYGGFVIGDDSVGDAIPPAEIGVLQTLGAEEMILRGLSSPATVIDRPFVTDGNVDIHVFRHPLDRHLLRHLVTIHTRLEHSPAAF